MCLRKHVLNEREKKRKKKNHSGEKRKQFIAFCNAVKQKINKMHSINIHIHELYDICVFRALFALVLALALAHTHMFLILKMIDRLNVAGVPI